MDEQMKMVFSIDKDLATEIEENGYAEIVFRKEKQAFRQFEKCRVEMLQEKEENLEETASLEKKLYSFRRLMKDTGLHSSEKRDLLSSLGADFFKRAGIGKYIPALQTAVGIADIAINAANFRAISKHLNSQDRQLDDLSVYLSKSCDLQLKELQGLENRLGLQLKQQNNELMKISTKVDSIAHKQLNAIVARYDKLIMQYNSESEKIERNEPNMDTVEALIMDMRSFLKEISLDVSSDDEGKEVLLNLIVGMIPSYAQLTVEFLKTYYMNENRLHKNYEMILSLYDELANEDNRKSLLDYYILQRGLHCIEAEDEIDSFSFLCMKCKAETEDELRFQIELRKNCIDFNEVIKKHEEILKDSIQKGMPAKVYANPATQS